jgi:outer membrane protein OmpU
MKKLLLATVAFVLLAPVAHAEIQLDVGGYFKGYAGYADQDTVGARDVDFKRKAQVFFTGETTLDNGLTVGYNGQLVQDTSVDPGISDAQIEQSYLFFSGNWGRINLGRENGAAYLLQVSAPGADSNLDGQDIAFSFFNQGTANIRQDYSQTGAGTFAGTRGENFQYSDKITYLTPKFNGFQAGLSYAPDVQAKDSNGGYFGMPISGTVTSSPYQDLLDAGLRYDGEFSGVGVHTGAGYTHADSDLTGVDTYKEWNAGLKLTYEGFGAGLAYNNRNTSFISGGFGAGGILNAPTIGGNVDTWTGGLDYTYGSYNFGGSYLTSKGDATTGGEDKYDRYTVGAGYTFGPGMKFNGSVGFHDLDADAAANVNKATVVSIGTDVQF